MINGLIKNIIPILLIALVVVVVVVYFLKKQGKFREIFEDSGEQKYFKKKDKKTRKKCKDISDKRLRALCTVGCIKSKKFQKEAKKCMKAQNCETKYPNKGFNYIKCIQDLKKGKHPAATQESLDKCIKLIAPTYC